MITLTMLMAGMMFVDHISINAMAENVFHPFWFSEKGWKLIGFPFAIEGFGEKPDGAKAYPFTAKGMVDSTYNDTDPNTHIMIVVAQDTMSRRYHSYVRGNGLQYDFFLNNDQGYYIWAESIGRNGGFNLWLHMRQISWTPIQTPTWLYAGWNIVNVKAFVPFDQTSETQAEINYETYNQENLLRHSVTLTGSYITAGYNNVNHKSTSRMWSYILNDVFVHTTYVQTKLAEDFMLWPYTAIYVWASHAGYLPWVKWSQVPGLHIGW